MKRGSESMVLMSAKIEAGRSSRAITQCFNRSSSLGPHDSLQTLFIMSERLLAIR